MRKSKKALSFFLAVLMLFSVFPTSVFAIDWNGTSSGGSGSSGSVSDNKFWVDATNATTNCVGYRFSIVDAAGNTTKGPIDVYRNGTALDNYEKSVTKKNKVDLIKDYNSKTLTFNTSKNITNCFRQSSLGIKLPDPGDMGTWQDKETNLKPIIVKLGYSKGVSDMPYGARLLVEPIWKVVLYKHWQCLTVSEIAVFGIKNYGETSCGGSPDYGASFGTVSYYTNNLWPNALRTGSSAGLSNLPWGATAKITDTNYDGYNAYLNGRKGAYTKNFKHLLTQGYGIGVGFTQKQNKPNSVTIQVDYYDGDGHKSAFSYTNVYLSTSATSNTQTYKLSYNETKEAFYKEGVAANTYYVWSSITTATTSKVCYTGKSFTIKAHEDDKTATVNYYYFGQLAVSPEVSSIKSTFTSQHNASVQSTLTGDSKLCGVLEGTRISSTATLGKAPSGYKYSFDQFTLFDSVSNATLATHTASATFGYSNSTQMVANKPKWVMATGKSNATTFKATFKTNGGTWSIGGTQTMFVNYNKEGSLYPPSSLFKTNYEFAGWKVTQADTAGIPEENRWSVGTVISSSDTSLFNLKGSPFSEDNYGNVTFEAQWEPNIYRIFCYNDQGSRFYESDKLLNFDTYTSEFYVQYGVQFQDDNTIHTSSITKIVPPVKTGYKFLGYYMYDKFATDRGTQIVDANGNILVNTTFFKNETNYIYAKWETFDLHISYWTAVGSKIEQTNAPYKLNPTKNSSGTITGYDVFDKNTNTYYYTTQSYGNVNKEFFLPRADTDFAITRPGYHFSGWTLCLQGKSGAINTNVIYKTFMRYSAQNILNAIAKYAMDAKYNTNLTKGDVYVYMVANWEKNTSSLVVDPNSGVWKHGSTSYTDSIGFNNKNAGSTMTIEVPTKVGSKFIGWSTSQSYPYREGTGPEDLHGTLTSKTTQATYTFSLDEDGVTDYLTAEWEDYNMYVSFWTPQYSKIQSDSFALHDTSTSGSALYWKNNDTIVYGAYGYEWLDYILTTPTASDFGLTRVDGNKVYYLTGWTAYLTPKTGSGINLGLTYAPGGEYTPADILNAAKKYKDQAKYNLDLTNGHVWGIYFVARWSLIPITYDKNTTDTVSNMPSPNPAYKTYDKTFTISSSVPTRTGYTFTGWNTKKDGTGTAYAKGASYTANTALTLYAQWAIHPSTLKVNPNGGTWNGFTTTQSYTQNYKTTKSIPLPTRTGYTFKGWSLNPSTLNGTLSSKTAAATYTFGPKKNAVDTITAQWTANTYKIHYYLDGKEVKTDTYTYGVGKSSLYSLAAANGMTNAPSANGTWYVGTSATAHGTTTATKIGTTETGDKYFHKTSTANTYKIHYYLDGKEVKTDTYTYGVGKSSLYSLAAATGKTNAPSANATWYVGTSATKYDTTKTATSIGKTETGDKYFHKTSTANTYKIHYYLDGKEVKTDTYTYGVGKSSLYSLAAATGKTNAPSANATWYVGTSATKYDASKTATSIGKTETGDKYFHKTSTFNSYTIKYDLNGGTFADGQNSTFTNSAGTKFHQNPTSARYMGSPETGYSKYFRVQPPTKTGSRFLGWKITGMDGTEHHVYRDANETFTNTSLSKIKDTLFYNLRATSGTVTFTAEWEEYKLNMSYWTSSGSTIASSNTTYKLNPSSSGFDVYQKSNDAIYYQIRKFTQKTDAFTLTKDTTFSLTRAGYHFGGWRLYLTGKNADGSSKAINTGVTYTTSQQITADAILNVIKAYASSAKGNTDLTKGDVYVYFVSVWNPNKITVNFNLNNKAWTTANTSTALFTNVWLYKWNSSLNDGAGAYEAYKKMSRVGTTNQFTASTLTNGTYAVYAPISSASTDIVYSDIGKIVVKNDDHTVTSNYYSITLTKGTGIDAVSGNRAYVMKGKTVTLGATVNTGYTWKNWTGTTTTTTKAYKIESIAKAWALTANATLNTYTASNGHWMFGLKNGEGTSSDKKGIRIALTTTSFNYGANNLSFKTSDYLSTLPNGVTKRYTNGNLRIGTYLDDATSANGAWKYYVLDKTFTNVNTNVTTNFYYDLINYNITYDYNGGTAPATANPKTYNVVYGATFANKPTRTGYTFKGWTIDGTTIISGINTAALADSAFTNSTTVAASAFTAAVKNRTSGDKTVKALWTPNTYTVEYYLNGTKQAALTQTCEYGKTYKYQNLPTITTDNHWVSDNIWNTKSDISGTGSNVRKPGASFSNLTTTNKDVIKLYAKTTANVVTVSVNLDGKAWTAATPKIFDKVELRSGGSTVATLTNTAGTNKFTVSGIQNGTYTIYTPASSATETLTSSGITITVNNNSPSQTVNYYSLTVKNATGTSNATGSRPYVRSGVTVQINTSVNTGYTWKEWTGTSGTTAVTYPDQKKSVTVTDKTILTATATENKYTVQYYLNGTLQSALTQTNKYTATNKYAAFPDPPVGYDSIDGWFSTSDCTGATVNEGASYSKLSAENGAVIKKYAKAVVGTYKVTVSVRKNDTAWKDSGLTMKLVNKAATSKQYTLTATSGTNSYVASKVPNGTYVIYAPLLTGGTASSTETYFGTIVVSNANATKTIDYYSVTLTGDAGVDTSKLTGAISWIVKGGKRVVNSTDAIKTGYDWIKWINTGDSSEFSTSKSVTIDSIAKSYTLKATTKIKTYTITYNKNTTDTVSNMPTNQTKTYGVDLTLSDKVPTRTGYTFKNWNTKSDGSGTTYAPSAKYTANASVTLYAIWTQDTYTATINHWMFGLKDGEGTNTAKTAIKLGTAKKTFNYGSNNLTFSTTDSLTSLPKGVERTLASGKQQVGTYLLEDGSGVSGSAFVRYNLDKTFTNVHVNPTVQYDYKLTNYTITYNYNGGTAPTTANPTSYSVVYGATFANKPTRTGYTFKGWTIDGTNIVTGVNNTNGGNTTYVNNDGTLKAAAFTTDASGVAVNFTNAVKNRTTGNITVKALWTPNTYTVTYNKNTTDTVTNMPANQTKTQDVSLTLSSNVPVRTGYTFKSWNTKTDGSGTTYNPGASYTTNSSVTLYAIWTPNTYKVQYYVNDVLKNTQNCTYDKTFTVWTPTVVEGYKYTTNVWKTSDGKTTLDFGQTGVKNLTPTNNDVIKVYVTMTPYVLTVVYWSSLAEPSSVLSNSTYKFGGTGSIYTTAENTYYTQKQNYNEQFQFRSAADFGLSRSGHTFSGWYLYFKNGTTNTGVTIDPSTKVTPTQISQYIADYIAVNPGDYSATNNDIAKGDVKVSMVARWTKNTIGLNYNANGGVTTGNYTASNGTLYYNKVGTNQDLIHSTSSTSTTVYKHTFTYNTAQDLLNASTFCLAKTGYTFKEWNSKSDGKGTAFDETTKYTPVELNPAVLTGNVNMKLYAIWTPNPYKVEYYVDGVLKNTQNCTYDTAFTAWTPAKPAGHSFTSTAWKDANGNTIANFGATGIKNLTATKNGTVKLYATTNPNVLSIYYWSTQTAPASVLSNSAYKFGGTGSVYTVSGNTYYCQKQNYNSQFEVKADSFFGLSRPAYTFNGWYLYFKNGSVNTGVTINAGTKVTPTQISKYITDYIAAHPGDYGTGNNDIANGNVSVTMIARWAPVSYTATFIPNGGVWSDSTTANKTKSYTVEQILKAPATITKAGAVFSGWKVKTAADPNGKWTVGTIYATNNLANAKGYYGNVTFEAQWDSNIVTINLLKDGAPWTNYTQTNGLVPELLSIPSDGSDPITVNLVKTSGTNEYVAKNVPNGKYYVRNAWSNISTERSNLATITVNENSVERDLNYYTTTLTKGTGVSSVSSTYTWVAKTGKNILKATPAAGYKNAVWNGTMGSTAITNAAAPYTVASQTDKIVATATATPITYTVHYNGNGATSGSTADSTHVYDVAKNLTTNGFIRKYNVTYKNEAGTVITTYTTANTLATATWTGWAKTASGAVAYGPTQPISVKNLTTVDNATVQLYAKWDLGSVTLPTPPAKTGYTPTGWVPEGSPEGTTPDKPGSTVTPTKDTTFVPVYEPIKYTVHYNGNGATSGSTANSTHVYDVAKNLTTNGFVRKYNVTYKDEAGNKITSYGASATVATATWNGWAKTASGAVAYGPTQPISVKNLTTVNGATVQMYAKWTLGSITLPTPPAKTGYTPTGWIPEGSPEGTTPDKPGSTVTPTKDTTFVPVYEPIKYTVHYNGNGATSGSTADSTHTYDKSEPLTVNGFIRRYTVTYKDKAGNVITTYTAPATTATATWNGWAKTATGAVVAAYAENPIGTPAKVKNLASTNGATVQLYAKWTLGSVTLPTPPEVPGYTPTGWVPEGSPSGTDPKDPGTKVTPEGPGTVFVPVYEPIKYTVHYNGNGATSGSTADSTHVYDVAKNLTTNGFVRKYNVTYKDEAGNKITSYGTSATVATATWKGWAKTASGAVAYGPTQPISVKNLTTVNGATIQMYAKWTLGSVTLPTPPAKPGYTPTGWVPEDTPDVDSEKPGTKVTPTKDTTFVPVYEPIKYTVHYNGNGATGGSTADSTHTYDKSEPLTVNGFVRQYTVTYKDKNGNVITTYTAPATKATATWNGWAKTASGSVVYTEKPTSTPAKVKNLANTNGATVQLYAKWTLGSVTLPTPPAVTGYTPTGWVPETTPNVDPETPGTVITPPGDVTYIPVYKPITYRIRFNANGGTGTMTDMVMTYGVAKNLTAFAFTYEGFSKKTPCWNTKADGTGTSYTDKKSVKNLTSVQDKIITLYAQWDPLGLELEPIMPNADYREGTDVVTSFNLINHSAEDRIPTSNVTITFKVYNGSELIKTVTQNNVIVPKGDSNLLYFKWTVPAGIDSNKVTITGDITEKGLTYGEINNEYDTMATVVSMTPETPEYEFDAPAGWTVPAIPANDGATKTWSVWKYENNAFVKETFGLTLNGVALVTPDENANTWTDETTGQVMTRSAYGLEFNATSNIATPDGVTAASADSYTVCQYANALMPEFSYSHNNGEYMTLEMVDGKFVLRQNSLEERSHFSTLWYPDGDYVMVAEMSDCWTPAGMITAKIAAPAIGIEGTVYDDWNIN